MRKVLLMTFFIAGLFLSQDTIAHPGRTDFQGCHTCRTNCTEKWGLEYGEYHCHKAKNPQARTKSRSDSRKMSR